MAARKQIMGENGAECKATKKLAIVGNPRSQTQSSLRAVTNQQRRLLEVNATQKRRGESKLREDDVAFRNWRKQTADRETKYGQNDAQHSISITVATNAN